jgi:tripartite-type tricarboxylate transporter receptor subunit TctC
MLKRREFIALAAGMAAAPVTLTPLAARAQQTAPAIPPPDRTWPNRPVRFIVPLAAGGGLDFVARIAADYLSRAIGQQVVIENKTGAGGTIGIETAIKSAPDGYAVLVTNDNVVAAPHVQRLNVDYLKDLVPVIQLARQPQALAVHPSFDVKSLAELIAAVKAQPGMGCATSGVGSNQHVLLEWFAKMAGVKLEHIPYRGAGQAINDLVAGHVRIAFLGPTALLPHYRAGGLRLLAQSGEARSPSMPEVPTLHESGFPGLALESWYGAFVPLGTPGPIVARLNAEIGSALADEGVRKSFGTTATEAVGGSAQDLARLAQRDSEKYARLVKELNIKAG